jgi:hypothetical protein
MVDGLAVAESDGVTIVGWSLGERPPSAFAGSLVDIAQRVWFCFLDDGFGVGEDAFDVVGSVVGFRPRREGARRGISGGVDSRGLVARAVVGAAVGVSGARPRVQNRAVSPLATVRRSQ